MPFVAYNGDGSSIIRPPVKWAGGKGQLMPQFEPLFPKKIEYLMEPFVGGGAAFFHLQPPRAILSDDNDELINFYLVVRDKLEPLLLDLKRHQNAAEYYYRIRAQDPTTLNDVQRASRFLYLRL